MKTHRIKTLPHPFAALLDGSKTFELRRDDRGYAVGDVLVLCEWDGRFTGRETVRVVTYMCSVAAWVPGAPCGWSVLALGYAPDAATSSHDAGGER